MYGFNQWFRFYYARFAHRRIRKRVRVRLTRTHSLGAVCDYHTIRGRGRSARLSGERRKTAHGRQHMTGVLQVLLKQRLQPGLGQRANGAVDFLAVLKDNQRGDAHNAKLHS